MMTNERWEPIQLHEDEFAVSTMGRIKRIKPADHNRRKVGAILGGSQYPNGYMRISLNGIHYLTHRLVGFAFCSPPNNWKILDINHKNGIRNDNRSNNLEWCTRSENLIHARDVLESLNPPCGERAFRSKLTTTNVLFIREAYATKKHNQPELAHMFNVSSQAICKIINRITWKHI